jgi:RNA polymerase sigma-70 factor, ECF subfamily
VGVSTAFLSDEHSTDLSQSDGQLLLRYVSQRDMAAFRTIMERHQKDVLRMASALVGDLAQDAVQEGFLRLAREASTLASQWREGASLGAWLCTVVRNQCIDLLRKKQAVTSMTNLSEQASPVIHQVADESAESAEHNMRQALWHAVDTLPQLERAAVILRYRDGLSYDVIAEQLDKTVNHVGVLLHQALQRLRNSAELRAEVLP